MNNAVTYLVSRLKELSTYQGIMVLLTGVGVSVAPDKWQTISTTGVAIFGAVSAMFPDKFGAVDKK